MKFITDLRVELRGSVVVHDEITYLAALRRRGCAERKAEERTLERLGEVTAEEGGVRLKLVLELIKDVNLQEPELDARLDY